MIHIFNTVEEVLDGLAEYFINVANDSIATHGCFAVALSGGTSPKKLYELLASEKYSAQVDWKKVYFFFGDERYVPANNPASNYQMVKKVLLEPLAINDEQVFPVNTTLSPQEAAAEYMADISKFFKDADPVFDLVLLGLGDNAHTASLFPYTSVLHVKDATIKEVFIPEQQAFRITFTAALINMACNIAFLVYGESKAQAVHNILEGEKNMENFPAQLIQPLNRETEWFLDEAAAKKISLAN